MPMNRFVDRLKREDGVTLLELIVALALFAMVSVLIYGVVSFGFKSYRDINIENKLRDEGDLLMSSIITELYTFGPERVHSKVEINQGTGNAEQVLVLERTGNPAGESKVLIRDGRLYIGDQEQTTSSSLGPHSAIELACEVGNACETGLIQVKLQLIPKGGEAGQALTLQSNFGF